ncbi:MAG: M1 family metallopeptidase [Acidobacteriota bacterium]|nr:MAG: M1 family metallopeptidase [Acidobacteriota bacterium]
MNRRISCILFAVVMLATALFVSAQSPRRNFDRPQQVDVLHYTIRVSFDGPAKAVIGDTTIRFRPLSDGLRSVSFDAVDLSFESVVLEPDGKPLSYSAEKGTVTALLDRAYAKDETISIRFKYKASPKKGVYFVPAETSDGKVSRAAQIWTQGEPEEARHWFPSFDHPSDKATTEKFVTVENGLTVVGNGELLEKKDNSNGTVTWHYRMPVPHSVYLVSFVIGEYVKLDGKYKEIPLGYYTYPGREENARKAYERTADILRVFEELTGVDYPFNKYDQTIVARFQFGGMENITATTLADTELMYVDLGLGDLVLDLIVHEIAHSWFGNLVTCKNWAELWLNEGWATFLEAAYREKAFGRQHYLQKIRADAATFLIDEMTNRKRHALYNQRADRVDELFDNPSTTYSKGGAVLHTLREEIGDDAFWKGANIYLNRHKFAGVETTDFQAAMEESSGRNLDWFFDQWVYSGGAPNITVRPVYVARTKTLRVTVTQTQRADSLTPAAFRLPLELSMRIGGNTRTEKLEVSDRTRTFSFPASSKPAGLTVDPAAKIPIMRVRLLPVASASR